MKIKILVSIVLMAAGVVVKSQNNPHTILWQVSRPGVKYMSYLFGTFHQVNPNFFDSLTNTNRKLLTATTLFVEDYKKGQEIIDTAALKQSIMTWNKKKWQEILDTAQLKIFADYATNYTDTAMFSVSPEVLMIVMQYAYFQGVCDIVARKSYQAMDTHITDLALGRKMAVEGLDKDQLQDLKNSKKGDSNMSTNNILSYCIKTMKLIMGNDCSDCVLLNDYKKLKLNYSLDKKMKGLEILLDNRNKKWMKILPAAFNNKSCFVAVGFRHLFYTTGLIQSLRRQGYTVTPIAAK